MTIQISALALAVAIALPSAGFGQTVEYRVLATNKTSTMQKEMSEAAEAGFRFAGVMGGETAFGGKEVVAVFQKSGTGPARFAYRLLATSKTSTMQRELQQAANEGFEYVGQTVFESTFGGREVTVILERDKEKSTKTKYEYKLLATSKTGTLQKELAQAGATGYETLGMTVGQTAIGGSELVVITRKALP